MLLSWAVRSSKYSNKKHFNVRLPISIFPAACITHGGCKNGGRCEPHTGQCLCPPGWKGIHCQNSCGLDKYGLDCTQQCNCSLGKSSINDKKKIFL